MNKNPSKSSKNQIVEMAVTRPNAAGIDIGSTFHVVAVPPDSDEPRVRRFGAMTSDLREMADWLKKCGVQSVAMESTGVYWRSVFTTLVENGFEALLVNATHLKNVTGRKTDEDDAMWIQKLHSCDLLKSSYLPDDEQSALRTLVRFRKTLTEDCSRSVLRMQKSLELMNIKVYTVINDITGVSGTRIIEAILNGERNPLNFLPLLDHRIKADHDTIVKSLEGNWREEHLFTLKSSYQLSKSYKLQIAECDQQIEQYLKRFEARQNEGLLDTVSESPVEIKSSSKKKNKNTPRANIRKYLYHIHGVDVTEIYGMGELSALQIFAETGTDLSKWENEKHFVSWLNLSPNNKVTGGKVFSSRLMKRKPNIASQAFRQAANGLGKSDNWLGDYFRRMKAKGGNKYAVVATANKLATIYYKMVRYKQTFKPVELDQYQQKYKKAKIAYLERKLENLKKQVA
jgi:transposase